MDNKLGVALIGAGPFGSKRARAVAAHEQSRLVVVADSLLERAQALAEECGCEAETDWRLAVGRDDVQAVIVSTPAPLLAEISLFAIQSGKHTLAEKPFGRSSEEVRTLMEAALAQGVHLKAGYNHRYHPAIRQAHELCVKGAIGRPIFLRAIYGHGGRAGYQHEWRTRAELSGGGELMDQGVHLLDLLRWFAGEFLEAAGMMSTSFWPISLAEDNVFALLRSRDGAVAELHASWTEWKNAFRFEVFGERGYLRVNGLGGSYGSESLCVGVREKLGEVPREQLFEFPGPDESLLREWEAFVGAVLDGRAMESDGLDALQTMRLVEAIYRAARQGSTARLTDEPAVLSSRVTAARTDQ
jgi:predicted dehydrogenase